MKILAYYFVSKDACTFTSLSGIVLNQFQDWKLENFVAPEIGEMLY